MKKTASVLLALIMLLCLAACGGEDSPSSTAPVAPSASGEAGEAPGSTTGEGLTVGLSMYTLEYPFYVTMHDAFIEAAEGKGWDVAVTNANTDVNTQLNDCMDLLSKDIDVLVLSSWYGDALADVFDICAERGIPVFMMDTATYPEDAEFMTRIGTDNYDGGLVGGTWTAKYLAEQNIGEVDIVGLHSGDQVSVDRFTGLVDGLKENGITVNILNEYHSKSREEAMAHVEDALTTYPQIDLFVCTSAQHGMGAYGAADAAGRSEMKILSYDGEQEEMDAIDEDGIYLCTVMQLPADMARTIVDQVEAYVTDGTTPERIQFAPAGVYCTDGALTADDVNAL